MGLLRPPLAGEDLTFLPKTVNYNMEILGFRDLPLPPDKWPENGVHRLLRRPLALPAGLDGGDVDSRQRNREQKLRREGAGGGERKKTRTLSLSSHGRFGFNLGILVSKDQNALHHNTKGRMPLGAKRSIAI